MKKTIITTLLAITGITANAQTIYLCKDGDYTTRQITQGLEVNPADYDSITFSKPQITPVVRVTYSGSSATVAIPSFISSQVSASVSGANVTINSTTTDEEVTYLASGTSSQGSLTINGQYKLTLQLNALNLTSSTGAAIDIQCGKRTNLILTEGTVNTLADAANGIQKAALYCRGHLEVEGAGTLKVSGNHSHAIATKEYLQLKRTAGTIDIVSSANDAIHAGQYFMMNGGTINIDANTTNDGIQAEATTDPLDEFNGQIFIKGGTINATIAKAEDSKAIKADSDIAISGGTINIKANANGSRGIQTNGNLTISESDATTAITITAAGGKCTLTECADDPHKSMGIKADGTLTLQAGTVLVYNTGKKSKAVKVGAYTYTGGTINVVPEVSEAM